MCLVTYSNKEGTSSLKKIEAFRAAEHPMPTWAYVEVTSACKHHCPWCYGSFPQQHPTFMSLVDFEVVLQKMKKLGVLQVTLTGGEPTENPKFKPMVALLDNYGFLAHVATNGDNLTEGTLDFLAARKVKQIQYNFQGEKWHDKFHGRNSFNRVKKLIDQTMERGMEAVATIVIGGYNKEDLPEIIKEAAAIGVSKIRVWDVLNSKEFLGDANVPELFKISREHAINEGYTHSISYDPEAEADVKVNCLAMEGLFISVAADGTNNWCSAMRDQPDLGNWFTDEPWTLVKNLKEYTLSSQEYKGTCKARAINQ